MGQILQKLVNVCRSYSKMKKGDIFGPQCTLTASTATEIFKETLRIFHVNKVYCSVLFKQIRYIQLTNANVLCS